MRLHDYDTALEIINTTLEMNLYEIHADPDLSVVVKRELTNYYKELHYQMRKSLGCAEGWEKWIHERKKTQTLSFKT